MTEYRIEHDTMGEVRVPADALYRAQTQRAVDNFPISGSGLESRHIAALARIKKAAALANKDLGTLDAGIADAIAWAADQIVTGEYDAQFPVDTYQTGSGTSSNMNMNEVLSTLATEKLGSEVHPNDHVNASQSSNDVFPTSVHVAVTEALLQDLIPAIDHLAQAFERKADEWKSVVKSGRTHLMDATPVTLGQEFGGYARQMRLGIERIQAAIPRVAEVPQGGTAVGTGINTPKGFPQKVIANLVAETGLPLTEAIDHFEAQANRDGSRRGVRSAAHHRRVAHEDQQRPALDGLGPEHRPRRDPHPGSAARVVDHARQGQPGSAGGRAHGVRSCHRKRRDGRMGRRVGRLRAQRGDSRHGHRTARVDPPARERLAHAR